MAAATRILRVFIASPGDLGDDRDTASLVILELQQTVRQSHEKFAPQPKPRGEHAAVPPANRARRKNNSAENCCLKLGQRL